VSGPVTRPGPDIADRMTVGYVPRQGPERSGAEPRWQSPPDPGDLSRRVAWRRAELRLSQAQVAARAKLSPRYLEYLERYPANPGPAVLRQLAAALRTTPAALLGAGAEKPPGQLHPESRPVTEKLLPEQCRRLIAPGGVGRIGFNTVSGPVVLPVNFAVAGETIVVRTGEGTLISGHASDLVAFEVDHIDDALCQGWSVLVRGHAHLAEQPDELRHLRAKAGVWPWTGGDREAYVCIVPSRLSGRRIDVR